MADPKPSRLPARSASPSSTIWRDLPEADFRHDILELEKLTNAVPLESQVFPHEDWTASHPQTASHNSQLSLADEQRLGDDISYIAAVGEGAQSVAAATVQEPRGSVPESHSTLMITVASIDAVDASSQQFLRSIFSTVSSISAESREDSTERLTRVIGNHHQQRLLNRLRSSRWTKPTYLSRTHKKPLHADFPNLIQRVQLMFGRHERVMRREVEGRLSTLASVLHSFEDIADDGPEVENARRLDLIMACYEFCTSPSISEYYKRLQARTATAQIQACLKTLQQTEKIAAYYRIPSTLVDLALRHPALFKDPEIRFLTPYESTPLDIAFQPWASAAHVHAEISLAVHHDTTPEDESRPWLRPRCVGASKYLCYLCYLFLKHHATYFPSATHGACYDQWTVPDLSVYPEPLRQRYRDVLRGMNGEVRGACLHATRRPEPMTSRENLLDALMESSPRDGCE